MDKRRILLIDDEESMHIIVTSSLRIGAQWQTLVSRSGLDGIAQAELTQPDAILLDVMMPDIDGRTLVKRLQNNVKTRSIPVIFFTAKAQSAELSQLRKMGVLGIITKPFNSVTLAQQLADLLGWSLA